MVMLLDELRAKDINLVEVTYRKEGKNICAVIENDKFKINTEKVDFLVKIPKGSFEYAIFQKSGDYAKGGKGELNHSMVWNETENDRFIRGEGIVEIEMIDIGTKRHAAMKELMEDAANSASGIELPEKKKIIV